MRPVQLRQDLLSEGPWDDDPVSKHKETAFGGHQGGDLVPLVTVLPGRVAGWQGVLVARQGVDHGAVLVVVVGAFGHANHARVLLDPLHHGVDALAVLVVPLEHWVPAEGVCRVVDLPRDVGDGEHILHDVLLHLGEPAVVHLVQRLLHYP